MSERCLLQTTRADIARFFRIRRGIEPSSFHLSMYESLWRSYKAALAMKGVRHSEAIRIAIDSPAPRFWISAEKASLQIFRKECGRDFTYAEGTKNRTIIELLYEKYKKLRSQPIHKNETRYNTVCWAVISEAPSYFISYRSARRIIETINYGIHKRL